MPFVCGFGGGACRGSTSSWCESAVAGLADEFCHDPNGDGSALGISFGFADLVRLKVPGGSIGGESVSIQRVLETTHCARTDDIPFLCNSQSTSSPRSALSDGCSPAPNDDTVDAMEILRRGWIPRRREGSRRKARKISTLVVN